MASSRSCPSDDLVARVQAFLAGILPAWPAQAGSRGENEREDESEDGSVRAIPRLTVAFSGGLDSSVLLHILSRLRAPCGFELAAAHVHHGLSAHADEWVGHCERICAQFGVSLQTYSVAVDVASGHGIEAAARKARHAVLASLDTDWIVLGHHADDQAETLLHRLVRGTGVRGAAAMRPVDPARRLMRPLLNVRRTELERYAADHGQCWVEDDSNPDTHFTRNFLRHDILAPLAVRFPEAATLMARAAAHFAEAADLLDGLARDDLHALNPGAEGSRETLRRLSPARARNLVRYWLAQAGSRMPDEASLDEGLRQLCSSADTVHWAADGVHLCAYRNALWLEPDAPEPSAPLTWGGERELAWAGGVLRFEYGDFPQERLLAVSPGTMELRTRTGGERLRLGQDRPSRSFRQWCQQLGIPAWWRDRLPILYAGGQVAWIGGIGLDAAFLAKPGESGWRITWLPRADAPFLHQVR